GHRSAPLAGGRDLRHCVVRACRRSSVSVPGWMWVAVIAGLLAVVVFDLWITERDPREFSIRQAGFWVSVYASLAVLFGVWLTFWAGIEPGAEFFAGYITEYSLSVDNLFVFYIIMSRFRVPRIYQHKVLL